MVGYDKRSMAHGREVLMPKHDLVVYNGVKTISPWNADSNVGWTVYGEDRSAEAAYFQRVPWLFRGVKDRSNNVGNMPFSVLKGETAVDESGKYTNWLEWLPYPGRVFRLLEMSLAMTGRAYLFLETNNAGYIKSVKYCAPGSIEVVRDNETNEITGYKRTVGKKTSPVKPLNILAIYDPDYTVEDGPGNCSAALAALTSAGVLYNADQFIRHYFERGAIKATVLSVDGGTKEEAERLTNWWGDVVAGIKNAWAAIVLRNKGVIPTVIGEGLDSLQNETLTAERRQNISTALGVPESKMWSSAANYATRVEDEKAYFQGTIIPECELIAEAFNAQVFIKEHKLDGVRLEFAPETLDIFQDDTNLQTQAALNFGDTFTKYPAFDLWEQSLVGVIGMELPEKLVSAAKKYYADKEAKAEEMRQNMIDAQNAPGQNQPPQNGQNQTNEPPQGNVQEQAANLNEQRAARAAWRRKVIHAVERGEPATVEFVTTAIPEREQAAIRYELEGCKTVEEVKAAFDSVKDEPIDINLELKRANDLLERALAA